MRGRSWFWAFGMMLFAGSALAAPDAGTLDLWKAKCQNCHGVDGKGLTKMGKRMQVGDMSDPIWHGKNDDAAIKKAIRDGLKTNIDGVPKKMDAYKDLTDAEVEALIGFIRRLQAKGP